MCEDKKSFILFFLGRKTSEELTLHYLSIISYMCGLMAHQYQWLHLKLYELNVAGLKPIADIYTKKGIKILSCCTFFYKT